MAGRRIIQQARRFLIDRNATPDGRHAIDSRKKAVASVARIKRFQPVDICDGHVRNPPGLGMGMGIDLYFTGSAHRLECLAKKPHAMGIRANPSNLRKAIRRDTPRAARQNA